MDSYGEILKKARLAKLASVEKVAEETAISKKYIEAIEEENEGAFPGETYLLGFLRSYAEYVELNPESVMSLFRAKKIQESPVPLGLLPQRKPASYWFKVVVLPIFLVLLLGAGITFLVIRYKNKAELASMLVSKDSATRMYELTTDKAFVHRLYKGDQITVPAVNGNVILTVADTMKHLALETPSGSQIIELSEEVEMDIDGDNKVDLIVYVSDVSTGTDRGAEARFLASDGGSVIQSVDTANIPSASEIASKTRKVIIADNRAYAFTVDATFRGHCVFRYRTDRREKIQEVYSNGDTLSMSANNSIRLWMSNHSAVKFQVVANSKRYDIDIGKAGEVKVEDVRWVRDTDGRYLLVITDIE